MKKPGVLYTYTSPPQARQQRARSALRSPVRCCGARAWLVAPHARHSGHGHAHGPAPGRTQHTHTIDKSPNWEVRASTGKMETSASRSRPKKPTQALNWPRIGVQRAQPISIWLGRTVATART
eukprot:scaffold8013_cov124-Isochrysis_galbana.AAC.22